MGGCGGSSLFAIISLMILFLIAATYRKRKGVPAVVAAANGARDAARSLLSRVAGVDIGGGPESLGDDSGGGPESFRVPSRIRRLNPARIPGFDDNVDSGGGPESFGDDFPGVVIGDPVSQYPLGYPRYTPRPKRARIEDVTGDEYNSFDDLVEPYIPPTVVTSKEELILRASELAQEVRAKVGTLGELSGSIIERRTPPRVRPTPTRADGETQTEGELPSVRIDAADLVRIDDPSLQQRAMERVEEVIDLTGELLDEGGQQAQAALRLEERLRQEDADEDAQLEAEKAALIDADIERQYAERAAQIAADIERVREQVALATDQLTEARAEITVASMAIQTEANMNAEALMSLNELELLDFEAVAELDRLRGDLDNAQRQRDELELADFESIEQLAREAAENDRIGELEEQIALLRRQRNDALRSAAESEERIDELAQGLNAATAMYQEAAVANSEALVVMTAMQEWMKMSGREGDEAMKRIRGLVSASPDAFAYESRIAGSPPDPFDQETIDAAILEFQLGDQAFVSAQQNLEAVYRRESLLAPTPSPVPQQNKPYDTGLSQAETNRSPSQPLDPRYFAPEARPRRVSFSEPLEEGRPVRSTRGQLPGYLAENYVFNTPEGVYP